MNIEETKPQPNNLVAGSPEGVNELYQMLRQHLKRMRQHSPSEGLKPELYMVNTRLQSHRARGEDALFLRRQFSGKYAATEENIAVASYYNEQVYRFILNQVVPNWHLASRAKRHPLALSFVDFGGSRHHEPPITEMPHYHSIYLMPARTVPRFEELIKTEFTRIHLNGKNFPITEVHCQKIESADQDLKTVIEYSSKFLRCPIAKNFSAETQSSLFNAFGTGQKKRIKLRS